MDIAFCLLGMLLLGGGGGEKSLCFAPVINHQVLSGHCFLNIAEFMILFHNFATEIINNLFAFIIFSLLVLNQRYKKTLYFLESIFYC